MDCKKAGLALSAMADGELDPARIEALEEHLARCPSCARSARVIEAVSDWFRAQPRPDAPEEIRDRVLERIRKPGIRLFTLTPFLRVAAAAAGILFLGSSAATFLVSADPPVRRAGFPDANEVMKRIAHETAPTLEKEMNR